MACHSRLTYYRQRRLSHRAQRLPRGTIIMIQALSRLCWKKLPLSLATKRRAKQFLFQRMPWLFRSMPAYQRWRLFNPDTADNPAHPTGHGTARTHSNGNRCSGAHIAGDFIRQ
jgi:hypothetical protein